MAHVWSQSSSSTAQSSVPKLYGDTVIEGGGFGHLGDVVNDVKISGGVHLHWSGHESDSLQKALTGLQVTTGHSQACVDVVTDLKAISTIFYQAGLLVAQSCTPNNHHVETLRSISARVSITLREFETRFHNLVGQASTFGDDPGGNQDDTVAIVLFNNEVHKLQQFAQRQLVQVNVILQMMLREKMHEMAQTSIDSQTSQESVSAGQMQAIQALHAQYRPIAQDVRENRQAIAELTSLVKLRQAPVSQYPRLDAMDTLRFTDALNRPFHLPYTYFRHWGTFESFLKSELVQNDLPGAYHIERGSFLASAVGQESKSLTQQNWASTVFPGCELSLTIVFSALRVSLLRCPRPGCGYIPTRSLEYGDFITCLNPQCGLRYRFDRNVELPATLDEEGKVYDQQIMEDAQRFGQRIEPSDIFTPRTASAKPKSGVIKDPMVLDGSHYLFGHVSTQKDQTANAGDAPANPPAIGPTAIDWNNGSCGLEAWLNTSAMPMNDPVISGKDAENAEAELKERESHEIQQLKRIHFVTLAQETKPLVHSVPEYTNMPLESQVYLRKIVDKFPALPVVIAERFARASLVRKTRLDDMRNTLDTRKVGVDCASKSVLLDSEKLTLDRRPECRLCSGNPNFGGHNTCTCGLAQHGSLSKDLSESLDSKEEPQICTKCASRITPIWRKSPQGDDLCNTCGLDLPLKRSGNAQPPSLSTNMPKKRSHIDLEEQHPGQSALVSDENPGPSKRFRIVRSCLRCLVRKVVCDARITDNFPCARCIELKLGCTPFRTRWKVPITACLPCRRRKFRCDGAKPCKACQRHGNECKYPTLSATC